MELAPRLFCQLPGFKNSMKKILIIDDEEDFCFFVKANLEIIGNYKVIVATDSKRGIAAISLCKPDLVLLDILMPGVNGLEVLKRLKEDKEIHSVPVIVISAKGDIKTKKQAKNLHCADYIVKPVEAEILKSKIESVLSKLGKNKI